MGVKHFNLPDPGEGLLEAEIVEWKVAVGDTVKINDIVVEIETAKSLVELPIPWAGTVSELMVSVGDEVEVFRAAAGRGLPVLLKGPTGCGKTRFVEAMAHHLGRELITVAGHEDMTSADLVGRFLLKGGETVWVDGPLTRAVNAGPELGLWRLRDP